MSALSLTEALLTRTSCEHYLRELAEDNSAWRAAFRRSFLQALQEELTARQYETLWRHYVEGESQRDIALALGISPSAVCRHIARARRRLQHLLMYNLDFQQRCTGAE